MYQLVSGIMDDRYIVILAMDGFSSSKYFQFNFGVSLKPHVMKLLHK